MPLGRNVRYRFKPLSKGRSVRLAYRDNKVVEATLFKKRAGIYHKQKVVYKRFNAQQRKVNKQL